MRPCGWHIFGLTQTGRKRDRAPAAARAERAKRSEDGTPEGVPHPRNLKHRAKRPS